MRRNAIFFITIFFFLFAVSCFSQTTEATKDQHNSLLINIPILDDANTPDQAPLDYVAQISTLENHEQGIYKSEIKTKSWSHVSLCSNTGTGDILVIYDILRVTNSAEYYYKTKYFILYRQNDGSYSVGKTCRLAKNHFASGLATAVFNQEENVYVISWNGKDTRDSDYSYFAQKIYPNGLAAGSAVKSFNSYEKDWNSSIVIMPPQTKPLEKESRYFVTGYLQDIPHTITTTPGLYSTILASDLNTAQAPQLIEAAKPRSNRSEFVRWFPKDFVVLPENRLALATLEGFGGWNSNPWILIFDATGTQIAKKFIRMDGRKTHDLSFGVKSDTYLIASTIFPQWRDGSVRYRFINLSTLELKPISEEPPFLSTQNSKVKSFKHKIIKLADDPGSATIIATMKYMARKNKHKTQVVANYLKKGVTIHEPKILIAEFAGNYDMVYSFDAVSVPFTNKACIALIHRENPKDWRPFYLKVFISDDLTK